jgi:hypothetical protein
MGDGTQSSSVSVTLDDVNHAAMEKGMTEAELDAAETMLAEVLGHVSPGTNLTNRTNLVEVAEARLAQIRSRREVQAALNLARSDTPLHGVMASRRLYGRPTERVLS